MNLINRKLTTTLLVAATMGMTITANAARDTIQIAGSSTVLPYASVVAEQFGQAFPQFKTPVVGSGGSGAGIKQFCESVAENSLDIANASRPMKTTEIETCKKNGVKKIQEVKIGYDGIVFAFDASKKPFNLMPSHLYAALAEKVPGKNGKLMPNPYTNWNQISKSLPNQEIVLIIPGSNHGTREVFEEKVLKTGADAYEYFHKDNLSDTDEKAKTAIRKDGRVIEIADDYTETLARLASNKNAIGVFGLGFYDANRDKLKVASVKGVVPNEQTVASGKYPVSRPLYFYVKSQHIGAVPGISEYTQFFLSEKVSGQGSQLNKAGLIALPKAERAKVLADFKKGKSL